MKAGSAMTAQAKPAGVTAAGPGGRWEPAARLTVRDAGLALALLALVLAYGLLTLGGHQYSSDGFVTFQSARLLITEGTLFFEPALRWGEQIITTSKYGLGMTLVYLVYLIPLRLMRPELFLLTLDPSQPYDQRLLYNDLYLYSSTLNAVVVACIAVMVYLTARELGLNRRWSTATALAATLASPLAVYARMDFSQPLTALSLTAALWLWLRAAKSGSVLPGLGAGLAMAAGVLVRLDFVVINVPVLFGLALWNASTERPGRRGRQLGLGLAAGAVAAAVGVVLFVNDLKFGSPFATGYPDAWSKTLAPIVTALIGHLFSPGAGLLWHFPLSALFVVSLWRLAGRHRLLVVVVMGLFVCRLALYSVWRNWPGGLAWGPRFLVPMVPLITIVVMLWAADAPWRRRRWVTAGIGLSWLVSLNGILFFFLDMFSQCGCLDQGPVGSERFTRAGSTLLSGWLFPQHWQPTNVVEAFDLLWLKAILGSSSSALAIASLAGLGLIVVIAIMRLLPASYQDSSIPRQRRITT
jgi:hypothetical protein